MIPDQYVNILMQMKEKTLAGKANWKATSSQNQFLISFKSFSLKVSKYSGPYDDSEVISFSVYDNNGKLIDDFQVSGGTEWELSNALYEAARRKAFNVDEVLKVISKELEADVIGDDSGDQGPF